MTVHIIGAGLSGLSAAVSLADRGHQIRIYEAAPHAGGRCRSYFDAHLGRLIDNGGHLLLGANQAAFSYLDAIGSRGELIEIAPAAFPFRDLETDESWVLRPSAGAVPWWILRRDRRVPGTSLADYLGLVRLLLAGPNDTVAQRLDCKTKLARRLVEPIAVAVMNTDLQSAAAKPLAVVIRETLLTGERACRPHIARTGLSQTFVEPALAHLAKRGAEIRYGARLQRIFFDLTRAQRLEFSALEITLEPKDRVVLSVPAWVAAALVPDLRHPRDHCAIVNAHFRLDTPAPMPNGMPILGLVGSTAQWSIARGDVVSVTVSAANALVDRSPDELLRLLWQDTAAALERPGTPIPPGRLIKEKRATFAQTPAAERQRPETHTRWENLVLAGDWTATGVPATIEGSIRSGMRAAEALGSP